MTLNEYQIQTRITAIYPENQALVYLTLGLSSEAGEVSGKVKKMIRDGGINTMDTIDEIGDVLYYLVRLCNELKIPAEEVLKKNIDKLLDRKARGVLKGSGDKR